jgi:hypothetical protein
MPLPPPPSWLEEWENEAREGFQVHPEYRLPDPTPCPQCGHDFHGVNHYQACQTADHCPCPGCFKKIIK